MRDLYAILGVPHDADIPEIRRAFRKLAATLHPDVGGGEGEFQEISLAKEILTDPDRRAEYDRTGRDSGVRESVIISQAREIIAQAMMEIALAPGGGVEDVATVDIVAGLKFAINEPLSQNRKQFAMREATLHQIDRRLKRMQGRFKRKDNGDNVMEGLVRGLQNQQTAAWNKLDADKKQVAPLELALRMLENYDYEMERAMSNQFHQIGFVQTSGPTFIWSEAK